MKKGVTREEKKEEEMERRMRKIECCQVLLRIDAASEPFMQVKAKIRKIRRNYKNI